MSAVVRLNDSFHYATTMSRESYDTLAWIADRYESAGVLYDGSRAVYNGGRVLLLTPEPVAWSYLHALEEEDGAPILPPCAGGPLADALVDLWQAVT